MMYCYVAWTSAEVIGVPSDHLTPSFSFHVTLLPSAAKPPFAAEGISFARIGTSGVAALAEIVASAFGDDRGRGGRPSCPARHGR